MTKFNNLMVFAAGYGSRMSSITNSLPKPLVTINGKSFLQYAIELALTYYPFKRIVVNSFYMHEKIEESVVNLRSKFTNTEIITLYEPELLQQGGGLKNALKYFDSNFVFTMNSDCILIPYFNIFESMIDRWDPKKMDLLLLLHPSNEVIGNTKEDFILNNDNVISVIKENNTSSTPYIYTGIQLINTNILQDVSDKIFPLNRYYSYEYLSRVDYIINKGYLCHATYAEDIHVIRNWILKHFNKQ